MRTIISLVFICVLAQNVPTMAQMNSISTTSEPPMIPDVQSFNSTLNSSADPLIPTSTTVQMLNSTEYIFKCYVYTSRLEVNITSGKVLSKCLYNLIISFNNKVSGYRPNWTHHSRIWSPLSRWSLCCINWRSSKCWLHRLRKLWFKFRQLTRSFHWFL